MTDVERHEQHMSGSWRERAACRAGVDPDLFFPAAESGAARNAQVRAAKAVCARCPVRAECLTEALARIPYGIAGGLTEHERRRLRTHPPHAARAAAATGGARQRARCSADGPRRGMSGQERAGSGGRCWPRAGTPRQVARVRGRPTHRQPVGRTTPAPTPRTDTTAEQRRPRRRSAWGGEPRRPPGSPRTSHPSTPRQGHEQRKDTEPR